MKTGLLLMNKQTDKDTVPVKSNIFLFISKF